MAHVCIHIFNFVLAFDTFLACNRIIFYFLLRILQRLSHTLLLLFSTSDFLHLLNFLNIYFTLFNNHSLRARFVMTEHVIYWFDTFAFADFQSRFSCHGCASLTKTSWFVFIVFFLFPFMPAGGSSWRAVLVIAACVWI